MVGPINLSSRSVSPSRRRQRRGGPWAYRRSVERRAINNLGRMPDEMERVQSHRIRFCLGRGDSRHLWCCFSPQQQIVSWHRWPTSMGNAGHRHWGCCRGILYCSSPARTNQSKPETSRRSATTACARAACATLPLALSQLAQYATSCIRGLYDLRPYFRTPSSVNDLAQRAQKCAAWELPLLSDNVFNSLKECIEVIDNEPAQSIIQLIGHTQIQRSRLEEYISRERLNDATHLVVLSNIEHAMYDAAEIHARTSTLFPFSRGYTAGSLAVTRERIYEALSLSGCFNDYSEISALADKWKRETLARETFRQKISVSGDPNGIDV